MDVKIRIQSKEGKEFEIAKRDAMLSDFIKSQLTDYGDESVVPLAEVDEKITEKVLEYLSHFKGNVPAEIEKPLVSGDMKLNTDEWSAKYVDELLLDDLVNLTVAANYLGIGSLLDLCCAKIAAMCKDKTEEEIFKVFNITETFTEEEKEKIRSENKWIEENL